MNVNQGGAGLARRGRGWQGGVGLARRGGAGRQR